MIFETVRLRLVVGIPVGEIVGSVVGFAVGLSRLGFMAKHTTYGFGEKV